MAFTGTHVRTLDDKNRLAIPKPFRVVFCLNLSDSAAVTIVVAPETEQALALFSEGEFQRRAEEVRASAGNSQEARTYLRLYFARAESVDIDKQGRIRLSERLMQLAGLQQEVVLVGVNDRVELWNRSRWEAFLNENEASFDEMARKF